LLQAILIWRLPILVPSSSSRLPLLHFQNTSLTHRFAVFCIFVWDCIIRDFKRPVTISTPESLHILSRSCIYFNIIMQHKILSIESFFQPFILLFKYDSYIQIMIMIVQIIVPTVYVYSHLLFSIFTSLASFISNTCGSCYINSMATSK
jgi:hypothetical protein